MMMLALRYEDVLVESLAWQEKVILSFFANTPERLAALTSMP
jgi:hypothetical protein